MTRLGEILLAAKALTEAELDSALENHVLYGVKLGTYLVEAGSVTDDMLAESLGRQTGKAFLAKDQLLVAGGQNLSLIAPAAIKKLRIIPVGVSGDKLRLATDNHLSSKNHAELEKLLGKKIEFVAVSGYAVDCFLEQMFGVQRPGRFVAQFPKARKQPAPRQGVGTVMEEATPVVIDGVAWKTLGEVTQDAESATAYDALFDSTLNRDDFPQTLQDVAEHLSYAKTRDDVAKAALEFASNSSIAVALVIIKFGIVRGWGAYANKAWVPDFETFSAPLGMLPDLQQCIVNKEPCSGVCATSQTELLWKRMNYNGESATYFPILIQNRVVAVLICSEADKLNSSETAELCLKISYALEILILRSKLLS